MKTTMVLAVALVSIGLVAGATEVDAVVAHVGSEAILKSDVLNEMRRGNIDISRFDEIREEMIDRKLIIKAAGAAKMTMQEWVVDNRVREIINHAFEGDRNKLIEMLGHQQVSYPEWRERLKEDMIVGAMRWQIVDKNTTASPADMKAEFKNHPERYTDGAKVSFSVILLKPADVVKRQEVGQVILNESFAAAAKKYSADSHAADGGVWKDVDPSEVFKEEVVRELAKTPIGKMSSWIEIDGWSFLLKKDAETVGKAKTFAEAYDDIEANVKEATAKRLYEAWLKRLRAETYVKVY